MFLTILCVCRTINKPPHPAPKTIISHIQPHLISTPKPPHPISNPILPRTHNCHLAHGAYTHPLACIFRPVFHCYLSAGNYRRYTEDIQKIYRRYTEDTRRIHEGYTKDIRRITVSKSCHSHAILYPLDSLDHLDLLGLLDPLAPHDTYQQKKSIGYCDTRCRDTDDVCRPWRSFKPSLQVFQSTSMGLSAYYYGSFNPPLQVFQSTLTGLSLSVPDFRSGARSSRSRSHTSD